MIAIHASRQPLLYSAVKCAMLALIFIGVLIIAPLLIFNEVAKIEIYALLIPLLYTVYLFILLSYKAFRPPILEIDEDGFRLVTWPNGRDVRWSDVSSLEVRQGKYGPRSLCYLRQGRWYTFSNAWEISPEELQNKISKLYSCNHSDPSERL